MEDLVKNVGYGVAGNAMYSLLGQLMRMSRQALSRHSTPRHERPGELVRYEELEDAIAGTAKTLGYTAATLEGQIRVFLQTPEAHAILRQVYAVIMSGEQDVPHLEWITSELVAYLSLHLQRAHRDIAPLADAIREVFLRTAQREIKSLSVEQLQQASASRYQRRVISDELASIRRGLDLLSKLSHIDVPSILSFEAEYREQEAGRYSDIVPPHLTRSRRVPIDELFVASNFAPITDRSQHSKNPSPYDVAPRTLSDMAATLHRTVVLGNPGGGKSTLAQKLAYQLSRHYDGCFVGGRRLTPVLVVLRDYGAERKQRGPSLLQFMQDAACSMHPVAAPAQAFEYLLAVGRMMVIFDGLDELLDTRDRGDITRDIESFCAYFPTAPVLVTSREVGYDQTPLDQQLFTTLRMLPFTHDQVEEYVNKWFALEDDIPADQQKRRATAFLTESRIVSDLRSNPLMLGLMCNLYQGERYIPQNRSDVYEKCSLMLFEKWDKMRGITHALPFEAHVRPTLMYLAHWIYVTPELQGGVSKDQIVGKAAEYLMTRRYEDFDEARLAARQFIEFCRGRAWVFSDTGSTARGENLYQFTHRTFLEYFAAAYIVRNYGSATEVVRFLLPHILRSEWDMVAQLAFHILERQREGAGEELLGLVLKARGEHESQEAVAALSFASRCLEFLVPTPGTVRDIVRRSVDLCMAQATGLPLNLGVQGGMRQMASDLAMAEACVRALLKCADDNQATVADELEKRLVALCAGGDDRLALLGFELGLHLYDHLSAEINSQAARDIWKDVEGRLLEQCRERAIALARQDWRLAVDLWEHRAIGISEVVRLHGLRALLLDRRMRLYPVFQSKAAESLLSWVFYESQLASEQEREAVVADLSDLGAIMTSAARPWIRPWLEGDDVGEWLDRYDIVDTNDRNQVVDLPAAASFAVFGILAVAVELEAEEPDSEFDVSPPYVEERQAGESQAASDEEWEDVREVIRSLLNSRDPMRRDMGTILGARHSQVAEPDLVSAMKARGFSDEQQKLIRSWVAGEESFVSFTTRNE